MSYSSNEVLLSVTYNISVYATKDGYDNSDVATATLCWIDVVPEGENIVVGVAEVRALPVLISTDGGQLTVSGLKDGQRVTICDLAGREVGAGTAVGGSVSVNTGMKRGAVAVVSVGGKAVKLLIR